MIRLLYITNSLSNYSETFIKNTVRLLEIHPDIQMTKATLSTGNNSDGSLNLRIPNIHPVRIIMKLFSWLKLTKSRDFVKNAYLNRILKGLFFDLVWIDFGNNAIEFYKYFNAKGKRVISHLHGYDVSKLFTNTQYCIELSSFSKNNIIIVPSRYNKMRLELIGCQSDNIYIVPYAFHGEKSTSILKNDDDPIKLIFVGRFVEKKDPRILIYVLKEVIKEVSNVELILIGGGPLEAQVKKLVKKLDVINQVIFTGPLEHNQVLEKMAICDIYVQHSITAKNGDQEGYPNTILEAQCMGLPVVSTIHAGIPEIVVDGETGFLIQKYDYVAMANKIIHLIKFEK